jgi:hypothetical protein
MTREHWKKLLPVITAFTNGEDVEFSHHNNIWQKPDEEGLSFFRGVIYRVAPKPRKVWVAEFKDGEIRMALTQDELNNRWTMTDRLATHCIELPPLP